MAEHQSNKLKGYIAISENNKASYIPEGDNVELTIIRVLEGKKFTVIDLSKINADACKEILKV